MRRSSLGFEDLFNNTFKPDGEVNDEDMEIARYMVDLLELLNIHGCDNDFKIDEAMEKLLTVYESGHDTEENIVCNNTVIRIVKKDNELTIETTDEY